MGMIIWAYSRVFRWRFRWVVRVNFAGHRWQNFVCGRVGTFPRCARILETFPLFVRVTGAVAPDSAVAFVAGDVEEPSWTSTSRGGECMALSWAIRDRTREKNQAADLLSD